MEHRRALITVADGTRLAAQLWLPGAAPGARAARGAPLPDGRPHGHLRVRVRAALRGGRLRRLPARHPRHRLVERPRDRRVHGRGARRHLPGDRVAGRAGVVERAGRDVRHLVVGLQLAPGRLPAPAGARRDRADLRLRRPLHRRRPLHGRRAQGARPRRLARSTWSPATRSRRCPPCSATAGGRSGRAGSTSVEPWLLRWFEEQADGPYWRHGSVRPGLRAGSPARR